MSDKNPEDNEGFTPLGYAIENRNFEICELIIESFGYACDKIQPNPLLLAANYGDFNIFQLIFENVSDKNPSDQFGRTALHIAAERGHQDICELIVERIVNKLDINPQDRDGIGPIELAARKGHFNIVELIQENIESLSKRRLDLTTRYL